MIPMFQQFGRALIFFGIIIVAVGLFLLFFDKVPFIGKLPGDIYIKKKNFAFYFPIATSIYYKSNYQLNYLFI